ncbi:MAG: DUF4011 domain-containing protein [Erysipelotrichaceae bacterium]|nr:DUF4011 domain-containing protein [Erysipelotrichaceae bacterium]
MQNTKLELLANKLLDFGKRNNLINFRDSKTASAEILLPNSNTLFSKLDKTSVFHIYSPKLDFDDISKEERRYVTKENYLQRYERKIKDEKTLLAFNVHTDSDAAIKGIDKKAREHLEETGVNVAYIAFGFIHWKESGYSNDIYKAPVLLVPVSLERESQLEQYKMTVSFDEMILNPTFQYKLETEQGLKLPEYDESQSGLNNYLNTIRDVLKPLAWEVSNECKLGIFSFLKINMYRDIIDNEKTILQNKNVLSILNEPIEDNTFDGYSDEFERDPNPIVNLLNVVDADSSQIEAIEMARAGKSFVLQGPPGTGKSQTITNIIAELLGQGKKVLFVSEKLAALNVVFDKLKQAGIDDFCLELHSYKSNKKEVIANLVKSLTAARTAGISKTASTKIDEKIGAQKTLDTYAKELHKVHQPINKSLFELYEDYYKLRNTEDLNYQISGIEKKDTDYLSRALLVLEEYTEYTKVVGSDYHLYPWNGFKATPSSVLEKDRLIGELENTLSYYKDLKFIINAINNRYHLYVNKRDDVAKWSELFGLLSQSKYISSSMLKETKLFENVSNYQNLANTGQEVLIAKDRILQNYDESIFNIDSEKNAKELKVQFSSPFKRFFNSDYKTFINQIRMIKKDNGKISYQDAVSLMDELNSYHELVTKFDSIETIITTDFSKEYEGVSTDWQRFNEEIGRLGDILKALEIGDFEKINDDQLESERDAFRDFNQKLSELIEQEAKEKAVIAECFEKDILDFDKSSIEYVISKLDKCLSEPDGVDNWIGFRHLLSNAKEQELIPFIERIIEEGIYPENVPRVFQKVFYKNWIQYIVFSDQTIRTFDKAIQDAAMRRFQQADREQFEINKAIIKSRLSETRPNIAYAAAGSALSILMREGQKKRKQMTVRNLMLTIGELIQRIKPCFLMSPLSVSTFLGNGAIHFDSVIFDEASQIFPQDAIGSIYRAEQLIVVGDSKQMPPSNFFNVSLDGSEYDDDAIEDIGDFESILDICSVSMPQRRLSWHYRSRNEDLISFSNRNFYDNGLLTFPSPHFSDEENGISYFYVNGIFDRKSRTNRVEAERVVDLIYDHIKHCPDRSLGVVAFSVAQQDMIDNILSNRRIQKPECESFFNKSKKEPFFIKNLETVQGDERDTIIFSTAYAKDQNGVFYHRFGPLNNAGGERRLNVAITRAKINVQLVTSLHYYDIDLSRTSAEGARLLREYLDFAENGEAALQRSITVNPFDQFDSDFEMEVCEFLRSNGYRVDTQVGCSGYKIDLALRNKEDTRYILAVECDGASYHSSKNARDRDRLRQEVLERMGWKFYRIWSTDWFKHKENAKKDLLDRVERALSSGPTIQKDTNRAADTEQSDKNYEVNESPNKTIFEPYRVARVGYMPRYRSYVKLVFDILSVEAPVSEEYMMKKTSAYFDRTVVSSYVKDQYRKEMVNCHSYGIVRKDGFLYIKDRPIKFRTAGELEKREIASIAPEELAAGMYELLKINVSAEKTSLYHTLADQCGIKRVTEQSIPLFDKALRLNWRKINVNGDMLSINEESN